MVAALGALADRVVSLVVPGVEAGACACNGCSVEVNIVYCQTQCAYICRDCHCNELSRSCIDSCGCRGTC